MGIALVQSPVSVFNTAVALTISQTFASAQLAGDLNIVTVNYSSTIGVSSVVDIKNGSYTRAGTVTNSAGSLITDVWFFPNIVACAGGANTVTVTFGGNQGYDLTISEWSGMLTASVVDQVVSASGSGTVANSSTSIPTTNANDLVYVAMATDNSYVSPGTGFTLLQETPTSDNATVYKIVAVTGAQTGVVNVSAGNWTCLLVAFKGASSGTRTFPTAASASSSATTVVPIARSDPHAASTGSAALTVRRTVPVFPAAASGSSAHVTVRAFVRPIPAAASGSSAQAQKTINVPAVSHSSASVTVRNPARPSPHGAVVSSGAVDARAMARPSPAALSSSSAVALSANAPSSGITFTPGSVYKNLSPDPVVMFGAFPGAMIDFSLVQGTRAEILQNAQMVLKTPLASVPLYRSFGVSQQWIGRPINQAQALICTDVLLRITYWEPRARCKNFKFSTDGTTDGSLGVQVSFEVDPNAPPASPLQTPLVLPVSKTVIDVSSGLGMVNIENVCA